MTNFQVALMAGEIGIPERASTAGIVTLLGMVAVFAVLAILWLLIEVMHRVLHKGEQEKGRKQSDPAPHANTGTLSEEDPALVAAVMAAIAAEESAVVAAITAAISASLAEEGHTGGFRVVSFRRADSGKKRRG